MSYLGIFWYNQNFLILALKMIKLKEGEKYDNLAQYIELMYKNRKCIKCGCTKYHRQIDRPVCIFYACKKRFSCYQNSIFDNPSIGVE